MGRGGWAGEGMVGVRAVRVDGGNVVGVGVGVLQKRNTRCKIIRRTKRQTPCL